MNLILPEIEPCESCGGALPIRCDGSGTITCPHCDVDADHILCSACADLDDHDDGGDAGQRMAA